MLAPPPRGRSPVPRFQDRHGPLRAPSLTLPIIAIGHAVGETSCAHPQTNQTSWSAHSDEYAGTDF
jgi:hypothetical protein